MTSVELARYLDHVTRYFTIISLEEAAEILAEKRPPRANSLVLTFDDGYRNNLTQAYPLLQAHQAPMTIYLTTGLIEQRRPMWVDRMDYALLNFSGAEVSATLANTRLSLSGGSREEKAQSFGTFRRQVKAIDCDDQAFNGFIDNLSQQMELANDNRLTDIWESDDWSVLLRWSDIAELDDSRVTFGSHTRHHYRLARIDPAQAFDELCLSKTDIEQYLPGRCDHFAYPEGSYDSEVCRRVREAGYCTGVTTDEGLNCIGDDLFRLKRIGLSAGWGKVELLARSSGLLCYLSGLKKSFSPWRS